MRVSVFVAFPACDFGEFGVRGRDPDSSDGDVVDSGRRVGLYLG